MGVGCCCVTDESAAAAAATGCWYLACILQASHTGISHHLTPQPPPQHRGGYKSGEEDYRFKELRKRIRNPIAWQAFALGFIAGFQNLLLLLITLPVYACVRATGQTVMRPTDYGLVALFLLLLVGESVADNQQFRFQSAKYALPASKRRGAHKQGFLQDGLFAYSRHPNFFCELGMWWTLYAFTITRLGWWNASGVGVVLLTLLFKGSLEFTEEISAAKYPAYATYQRTTSALIPWFKGGVVACRLWQLWLVCCLGSRESRMSWAGDSSVRHPPRASPNPTPRHGHQQGGHQEAQVNPLFLSLLGVPLPPLKHAVPSCLE